MTDEQIDYRTRQAGMRAVQPAGRFVSRILRDFPPGEIAALPVGWHGRYAFAPTGAQRPLTGTTPASVRQYVEERRAFAAAYENATPEMQSKIHANLMLFSLGVPTPDSPTVKVTITRNPDTISIVTSIRDGASRELDQEFVYMSPLSRMEAVEVRTLPGYARWGKDKLPAGAVARAFGAAALRPPPPAVTVSMRDPVANEPLAALTEPMDALAAATGGDAIVALPDLSVMLTRGFTDESVRLGEFTEGLASLCALRMEGGTLVGPVHRPTDTTFQKTNRTALRDLFRVAARGRPRLLDVARYAVAQNPESGGTGFEKAVWEAAGLGRSTPWGLFDAESINAVRLFGDLSPAHREALLAGGSLAVGEIGPAARKDLDRWIFARSMELDKEGARYEREMADLIPSVRPEMRLVGTPGLSRLFATYVAMNGETKQEDAQRLGNLLRIQVWNGVPETMPDFAKTFYRPGVWHDFSLAFLAAPGVGGHADLVDAELDPNARAVPYRDLPEAHRKAMEVGYGGPMP